MENVHLTDLTDMYVLEGTSRDLDIFRFDFMFVKPRDVPPTFCFNVQIDTV